MRSAILTALTVLVVAFVVVLVFASPFVRVLDARLNGVHSPSATATGKHAEDLHARLWIADLHCDASLWNRPLVERSGRGHVDVPRLVAGNVALQVFSLPNAYPLGANYRRTPSGIDLLDALAVANRWPRATWSSPVGRAIHQARIVERAAQDSDGRLVMVRSSPDLAALAAQQDDRVGAVLSVEGLHVQRDDLAAIDRLYAAGVRVFGLAHMSDNPVAGSAHGWSKGGLTAFGRRVVARIDSLGAVVDLAHASAATIDDVLAISTRPVLVSHTGVDGTCPGERNLSDDQVRRIAARGGVIGIGFWKGAVCGDDAGAIARAMRHAARVASVDAVALGSDFDGAVRTPFDAAGLVMLTDALLEEGFTDEEVVRIMGFNALEFFLRALPPD
jgi:microsomal dipeptidase-like Zn-dependent dipeptidase